MSFFIMIIIPEDYGNYRMISVDPGLGRCGVAIYDMYDGCRIDSINAYTLINEHLNQITGMDEERSSDRTLRLRRLHNAFIDIFEREQPAIVAFEAPFYNRFRPMAYGSLTETCDTIKYAAYEVLPNSIVTFVEPMLVKKAVGASKGKGKDVVREGISRIPEIMLKLKSNYDRLDEHSVDAIGVGYATIKYRRDGYV